MTSKGRWKASLPPQARRDCEPVAALKTLLNSVGFTEFVRKYQSPETWKKRFLQDLLPINESSDFNKSSTTCPLSMQNVALKCHFT